jgi:hypothetical protein
MPKYKPALLPEVDGVEVLTLGKLTSSTGESTFSMKHWAVFAVAAAVQADEHLTQHIAELWRKLPPGEQARCHVPPFALRFFAEGEVILEASLCWHCNNIWLREEKTENVFEFDARAEVSQELLAVLKAISKGEETEQ